jgi:hypothetical protein
MSALLGLLLLLTYSAGLQPQPGREDESVAPKEQKKDRKPAPKASPAKVYTDEDLKKVSPGSKGEDQAAGAPAPSEPVAESSEGSERPALVESEWRARAQERRTAVAAAEAGVRTMEDEAKALGLRILMSTDTYEILQLKAQQQEQTEQLEQARRGLVEAKQAMDAFEEEARRASVPPGWLREP